METELGDEIRLELRVKNNRLYESIVLPFGSIAEFCRRSGMFQSPIYALINLRLSPFRKFSKKTNRSFMKDDSPYTTLARKLAEIAGYSCDELFPLALYENVTNNVSVKTMSMHMLLESHAQKESIRAIECIDDQSMVDGSAISKALSTLTARENFIIKERFGLGRKRYPRTLAEVGRDINVTCHRVRQIEEKAIRKLRHPLRSKILSGDPAPGLKGLSVTMRDRVTRAEVHKFFRSYKKIGIADLICRYGPETKALNFAYKSLARFAFCGNVIFDEKTCAFMPTTSDIRESIPNDFAACQRMPKSFRGQFLVVKYFAKSKSLQGLKLTENDAPAIRAIATILENKAPTMWSLERAMDRISGWELSRAVKERLSLV